jgi:predicted HicB family RNase H-like nuclease
MNEKKTVKITLTVPEDLWRKLSIMAIEQKTSKNQLIMDMIKNQLKQ